MTRLSQWPRRVWSATLRLADALCGPPAPANPFGRHGTLRYLGLAAALAVIVVARRPDAILRPQFWAEDGSVFFYQQLTLGLWPAVRTWYGNFPFLVQRLIAAFATAAPTVSAPLVYNASAIVITALVMATFALPTFRHLIRSDGLRTAVSVATVCMPAGQELLGTPTTLGYFLAMWLLLLSVMQTPRTRAGVACWCAGGVLTVLSTQLASIAAPLFLLRAVRGVHRRIAADVVFAASQLLTLLALVAAAGGMAAVAGMSGSADPVDTSSHVTWHPAYLWTAFRGLLWVMACCIDAVLMPLSLFNTLAARNTWLVVAPAVIVALGVALALAHLAPRGRVVVGLAIYVMAASLYVVLAGRPIILRMLEGSIPGSPLFPFLGPRHRALANFALLLGAAGLIDGAQRAHVRLVTAAVTIVGLLVTWTPEFRIVPFPNLQWPVWAARLDRKLATGSREPLVIPSYPPSFEIAFDAPPVARRAGAGAGDP